MWKAWSLWQQHSDVWTQCDHRTLVCGLLCLWQALRETIKVFFFFLSFFELFVLTLPLLPPLLSNSFSQKHTWIYACPWTYTLTVRLSRLQKFTKRAKPGLIFSHTSTHGLARVTLNVALSFHSLSTKCYICQFLHFTHKLRVDVHICELASAAVQKH